MPWTVLLLLSRRRSAGEATRRRIRDEVSARPGTNRKALGKRLGVAWNAVRHHVRILQKRGEVAVLDRGWVHELFPADLPERHRPWLRALQDAEAGKVLGALMRQGEVGVPPLSEGLGLSPKVIRRHLKRFVDDGLAERIGTARPRYRPAPVPPDLPAAGGAGLDGLPLGLMEASFRQG